MGNLYSSIQALQKRLADAGVPSIVIGGVAVGVWGDPRVTRDVDLKVLLGRQDADRLLTILQPGYVSLLPDLVESRVRRCADSHRRRNHRLLPLSSHTGPSLTTE